MTMRPTGPAPSPHDGGPAGCSKDHGSSSTSVSLVCKGTKDIPQRTALQLRITRHRAYMNIAAGCHRYAPVTQHHPALSQLPLAETPGTVASLACFTKILTLEVSTIPPSSLFHIHLLRRWLTTCNAPTRLLQKPVHNLPRHSKVRAQALGLQVSCNTASGKRA